MNILSGQASAAARAVLGLLLVVVAAMALVVSSGHGEDADAAEIPATIDVTTTATSVAQWDRVDFTCRWQVPDNSQPGDTFTLILPDELRWMGATSFSLLAPDGATPVATASVAAGPPWAVTFTLTDYVITHPLNVHGTCRFSTQYVRTVVDGAVVELDFDVSGQVWTVPLTGSNPCETGCDLPPATADKWMWWSDPADQQRTHSVLFAPVTPVDDTTVTITDTPRNGLAIDCSSVVVTVGDTRASDGTVVPDLTATFPDPAHIACTPGSLTATWDLPAGWYMNVTLESDVTQPGLAGYHNDGTVTLDGQQPATVTSELVRTDAGGDGQGEPTVTPTNPTSSPTGPSSVPTDPASAPSQPGEDGGTHEAGPVEPGGASGDSRLPDTGASLTPGWLFAGGLLVAAGALLLVARARS